MKIIRSSRQLQTFLNRFRRNGETIGFVPTMGALHAGHMRLVQEARKHNDRVVVSIFVNPLQFGPKEDFKKYPRTLVGDAALCRRAGVDALFVPDAAPLFKLPEFQELKAGSASRGLCGRFRPGHFDGVVSIVALLFRIVKPNDAYFGLKDYQQYRVIDQMACKVFGDSICIRPVATIREKSGLAMSSRNRYMTPEQRRRAASIFKALQLGKYWIEKKKFSPKKVLSKMRIMLEAIPDTKIQYLEIVDVKTLQNARHFGLKKGHKYLIAVAVYLGSTRLIDNITTT